MFEEISLIKLKVKLTLVFLSLKFILQNLFSNRVIFYCNYYFFTLLSQWKFTRQTLRHSYVRFSYKHNLNHSNSFIHISQRNLVFFWNFKFPNSFFFSITPFLQPNLPHMYKFKRNFFTFVSLVLCTTLYPPCFL